MKRGTLLALSLLRCSAPEAPGEPETYVATVEDLQGFQRWTAVPLGALSAGGHPQGRQTVYLNRPRPAGGAVFPVGSVLVRTIEVGPSPRTWEVFAMAKRGGDYNADGARGWEFFLLSLTDAGAVRIIARGQNPSSGHEDRYTLGENTTCNSCHGLQDARPYDGVLSLPLRP